MAMEDMHQCLRLSNRLNAKLNGGSSSQHSERSMFERSQSGNRDKVESKKFEFNEEMVNHIIQLPLSNQYPLIS